MHLSYEGKKSTREILGTVPARLEPVKSFGVDPTSNMLIHGDNLPVLRALLQEQRTVDLIYIDPPFARNTTFRIGKERTSTVSARHSDDVAYHDTRIGVEFLEFLRARLILLRELLAPTGSIYLHIDDKIGHYVKILMDEVFGLENFRNDISRIKCNPKNFPRKGYGNIKDVIYFYTKTEKAVWNDPKAQAPAEAIDRLFQKLDNRGRRFTTNPLHAPGETRDGESGQAWHGIMPPPGRHWRYSHTVLDQLAKDGRIEWSKSGNPRKIIYAEDHQHHRIQDIWEFKDSHKPSYPTEKNLDLIKQIIQASSLPGQTVLDAFSGSGTTLLAAELLQRRWIGIDESEAAINVSVKRLTTVSASLFENSPAFVLKRQGQALQNRVPRRKTAMKLVSPALQSSKLAA